jgi:hypothetical protein
VKSSEICNFMLSPTFVKLASWWVRLRVCVKSSHTFASLSTRAGLFRGARVVVGVRPVAHDGSFFVVREKFGNLQSFHTFASLSTPSGPAGAVSASQGRHHAPKKFSASLDTRALTRTRTHARRYDNEWGYSCRVVDLIAHMAKVEAAVKV